MTPEVKRNFKKKEEEEEKGEEEEEGDDDDDGSQFRFVHRRGKFFPRSSELRK